MSSSSPLTPLLRFGLLLCWLGLHRYRAGWCDDGKGNAGPYEQCERCDQIFEELV